MFEQSLVEARALSVRPWTMAVSTLGQVALISAAVLWPLLHPDLLRRVAWVVPVISPPHAYHPPAVQKTDVSRAVMPRRAFPANTVFAPPTVPTGVRMIQDAPLPIGEPAGSQEGVPGGLDFASTPNPIIETLARIARPDPPAAVQTVTKAPATKPAEPIRVRVGTGVQAARLIDGPKPVYPPLARAARISGTVHLSALIGTDGRILDLRVVGGHPLLVGAAIEAVKRWVYRPTLLNGEPVEVVTEIAVIFTLQQ